jgi:hypothetical protein
LPDFLIIGAQKAGTSALYQYLSRHPGVRPAITKEVHYFDLQPDRGQRWYRGHFPRRREQAWPRGHTFLTGEATPYYLFHPLVPERVASTLPNVKLIVLLRDPVRRAISHFYHEVALGYETRPFARAIDEEASMMEAEWRRLDRGLPPSSAHQHRSYVSRGLYADQLNRWREHIDDSRLLIVGSDTLATDDGETYRRILRFLGVPDDGRTTFERVHRRAYPEPDPDTIQRLRARFEAPNRRLLAMVGRERAHEFSWIGDAEQRLAG